MTSSICPSPSTSVLAIETLAISNSCSSSSTSLFSSGLSSSSSQTDYSPPQSPTLDHKKTFDYSRHKTILNHCEEPLFIGEATPRQSSCKRSTDLFDVSHDVGYDSEREDRDIQGFLTKKVRHTRKDGFEPRRRGLRLIHPALPKEFKPCVDTSSICPLQPQILPIIGQDSPSPILLPSPVHSSGIKVHQVQCKNKEVTSSESEVLKCSDFTNRNPPSCQGNFICGEANTPASDSDAVEMSNSCVLSSIPRTRKAASGIGLGLPSVLCRPHSLKEGNQRLVSIDVPSPRHEYSEESSDCHVQESFSIPLGGLGIIAGARRFLRTNKYPKRHLYDIPEHISPKFSCKTMAMGKSLSSRSPAGLSPLVVPDLSKFKRLHSPLLNVCKKPLQWFSSRSPTTGRRTSPVIVHDGAQRTPMLSFAPQDRGAGSSKAAVLF